MELTKRIVAGASARGYKFAFVLASAAHSQRIFRRQGFELGFEMPYREFKLDDTYPFASIEDPPSAIVYYKRLWWGGRPQQQVTISIRAQQLPFFPCLGCHVTGFARENSWKTGPNIFRLGNLPCHLPWLKEIPLATVVLAWDAATRVHRGSMLFSPR